jgi:glycerol-3-phosphate acyltransferase PlsY
LRFRGGKGVATSLGVILAYDPALGGVGVVAYALVLAVTRVSAVGSLSATGLCVAAAWLWPGEQFDLSIRLTLIAICVLIVWRHRSNLGALRQKKVDEKA